MFEQIRQLAGPVKLEVCEVVGRALEGAESFGILHVGTPQHRAWLCGLFCADAQYRSRRQVGPHAMPALMRQSAAQYDLILADIAPLWARLTNFQGALCAPAWVRQTVHIPPSGALPRKLRKEVARQQRHHEYRVTFTDSAAAFTRFYRELYRPYVAARYESSAILVNDKVFAQRCRGQQLAILQRGKEWIAAMVLLRSAENLRFGWFGSCSAPPQPGASEVLDSACIEQARQWGIRQIVMGNSRPSLEDGVVRYKAKFGAHIVPTRWPQSTLILWPCATSPRKAQSIAGLINRHRLIHFCGRTPVVHKFDLDQTQVLDAQVRVSQAASP